MLDSLSKLGQLSGKLTSVEALRGVASVAVALFHLSGNNDGALQRLGREYGHLGVDVFFVISGFVIPLSLHRCQYRFGQFGRFFLRRILRLEPAYLASVFLHIAAVSALWIVSSRLQGFAGVEPDFPPLRVVLHFFYFIPLSEYDWISPVYWSLGYEFVFYILIGLLFPVLTSRPFHVLWGALIVAGVLVGVFDLSARVLAFLLGIALFITAFVRPSQARMGMLFMGVALAGIGVLGDLKMMAAVLLALIGIVGLGNAPLGRITSFLARISYSLYLTHWAIGTPLMSFSRRLPTGELPSALYTCGAMVVYLVFAFLFAKLFEEPAVRWSKRIRLAPDRGSFSPARLV